MKMTSANRRASRNHRKVAPHIVQVEFNHPTAEAVAIAGSFNEWRPEATRMVAVGEGRWLKELVLPPGTYEYLFVADGQWLPDPRATKTVPNPFGGVNCVFEVSVKNGAGAGAESRPSPRVKRQRSKKI